MPLSNKWNADTVYTQPKHNPNAVSVLGYYNWYGVKLKFQYELKHDEYACYYMPNGDDEWIYLRSAKSKREILSKDKIFAEFGRESADS